MAEVGGPTAQSTDSKTRRIPRVAARPRTSVQLHQYIDVVIADLKPVYNQTRTRSQVDSEVKAAYKPLQDLPTRSVRNRYVSDGLDPAPLSYPDLR